MSGWGIGRVDKIDGDLRRRVGPGQPVDNRFGGSQTSLCVAIGELERVLGGENNVVVDVLAPMLRRYHLSHLRQSLGTKPPAVRADANCRWSDSS